MPKAVMIFEHADGRASSTDKLINWGRVTQICVSKLTIIGSDNGLSPGRPLSEPMLEYR